MFTKRKDQSDINCLLPGSRIFDILSFGSFSRCFLFGGGSKSSSSQSTTQKDNSSVGEDEFLNTTDGSAGARDEAVAVTSSGNQNSTSVDQSFKDNSGQISLGNQNQIEINSVDSEITGQAFQFAQASSGDVFEFAKATVEETVELSSQAQDSIADTFKGLIQFSQVSQAEANDLTKRTNEVLATKSSDADSAVSATLQKNMLIALAIIGIVIAYQKRNKK